MDNTASLYDPKLHGDSEKVENYRFRHEVFEEALQNARSNEPRFKAVSMDKAADIIGLSSSNFQRLRRGEVPDPRSSTIWLISVALHVPPYKLLGLPAPQTAAAPIEKNPDVYVRDLERRDELNRQEIAALHAKLEDKTAETSTYHEQVRAQEETIAALRDYLKKTRRQRVVLTVAAFVLTAALACCLYAIMTHHHPITEMLFGQ